jgi:hypothetical protein
MEHYGNGAPPLHRHFSPMFLKPQPTNINQTFDETLQYS